MDGGGRIAQPLNSSSDGRRFAAPAFSWIAVFGSLSGPRRVSAAPASRARVAVPHLKIGYFTLAPPALAIKPGFGTALALVFLLGTASVSLVQSGQYAKFAAQSGGIGDILARSFGFGVKAIVITTDNGMTAGQVLPATGITQQSSTLFLRADAIRRALLALPRVKTAAVRVLYPDRVVIDVTERRPFAIWQDQGKLSVISADGTPIETASSRRWAGLPFVVGPEANRHIDDFARLVASAPTLRAQIRAGVLVSGRRWDLKMTNGVDVRLPEHHASRALKALALLEVTSHVLEKDVLSLDFRAPGRMVARLSADAYSAREDALKKKKSKGLGNPT